MRKERGHRKPKNCGDCDDSWTVSKLHNRLYSERVCVCVRRSITFIRNGIYEKETLKLCIFCSKGGSGFITEILLQGCLVYKIAG